MDKKQRTRGRHFSLFFVCMIITPILLTGCSHLYEGVLAKSTFEEAGDSFNQGNYEVSLNKYQQIVEQYPSAGDRALFEMGIIYTHTRNERKDYRRALDCFQKLIRDYPASQYRQDAEMMVFYINNVTLKDKNIIAQQAKIETLGREVKARSHEISEQLDKIAALEQEVKTKADEIIAVQKKMGTLEQKVFALQNGPADKILIEKKARRLTLLAKDKVLRTYKIALGGNPEGPKEKQGDNKTPEGMYLIDAKNQNSRYHLSLHISYPNEKDKRRARERGVSPGGDVMIHGMKNGFSSLGDFHTELDWTKGCIAVADAEMEEIYQLVPKRTVVEIRP